VAKTVAKKVSKNAAAGGAKAAGKKPVKGPAKPPVKKVHHDGEKQKPLIGKTVKKPAVAQEKTVTRTHPVKKIPQKRSEPEEEPREKPVGLYEDKDTDSDPVDEGLRLIQSRPDGILQSELWKELGVDSRKCSRIVKRLEESGLIERLDFKREGIKTYLLRAKQQPVNPAELLAGDELIPCIGCELECVVEECHPLMDWMYQLAIVQHTDE
jgi:uncharacterized membrane protein